MICDVCKWDYPFEFLAPFRSNHVNKSQCCGICALQLSNEAHGIQRSRFDGETAEATRQLALRWRKRHPSKGPQQDAH